MDMDMVMDMRIGSPHEIDVPPVGPAAVQAGTRRGRRGPSGSGSSAPRSGPSGRCAGEGDAHAAMRDADLARGVVRDGETR